jgi:hypothetical protein
MLPRLPAFSSISNSIMFLFNGEGVNNWYQIQHSCVFPTLEDNEHFTRRQKHLRDMEPNTKLLFEDLMKQMLSMHKEMKAGFAVREAVITKHFTEIELVVQQRDKPVVA